MWGYARNLLLSLGMGCGLVMGLLASLLAIARTGQAAGATYCVVPPGGNAGPFADCDQVFTSVQAAVDTAVGGEEIWVATGVYTAVHARAGVTQSVYLDKDVTLRGGYVTPFNAPPDPAANPTTFDAQQQGRVVYVVTGTTALLDGLSLTDGSAAGLGGGSGSGDDGGGLYAISATVTISNGLIFSNTAASVNFGRGGGLAFTNSVVTITGSAIQNNVAGQSGGGAGGGLFAANSTFYLAGNKILSNTAAVDTGLLFIASFGGGLAFTDSSGWMRQNVIEGNVTLAQGNFAWGGGVYFEQFAPGAATRLLFDSNQVRNNASLGQPAAGSDGNYGWGGGVLIYNSDQVSGPLIVTMTQNVIAQNTAAMTSEIGMGGGVLILSRALTPTLTFRQNELTGNVALEQGQGAGNNGLGGGLVVAGLDASLAHNRFLSNTAVISGSSGSGGGVYFYRSQVTQQNDLVLDNAANLNGAGSGGGGIFELTTAVLTNVVAAGNQASEEGAALWLVASDVKLLHSTLARNRGSSAIYMRNPSGWEEFREGLLTLKNGIVSSHTVGLEIFDNNTAVINGVLWHDTPLAVSQSPFAVVTLQNQVVGDPMFAADGYHIGPDSAARGRGGAAGVMVDIDGEGRPSPPALGADEYWLTQLYLPLVRHSQ